MLQYKMSLLARNLASHLSLLLQPYMYYAGWRRRCEVTVDDIILRSSLIRMSFYLKEVGYYSGGFPVLIIAHLCCLDILTVFVFSVNVWFGIMVT